MSRQTDRTDRIHRDASRAESDRSLPHLSAQDARQGEIVLDTPGKRILVVGIFVAGLIVLGFLILYA
ncbi:MAG: hypothetical protein O3A96_14830 [Proteobacteria bacterium]|nr:hypothetical protein [Pseudomonadota bacterium]